MVPSSRIPQVLKDATVAIEDKRFYEHDGVDYYRLVGAAVRDMQSGSATQGGSTITMQLIKNLYDPPAGRTISKKIEEAYLAFQYEKKYTKDEILTKYLNGVFYGQNAIGVQAASLTYFDKDVSEINLQQAALLAGLPQAPSQLQPLPEPGRGEGAAQHRARPDGRAGLHLAGAGRQGDALGHLAQARHGLQAQARGVLLRVRPPGADRPLRREAGAAGRVQGLHDHRPGAAGGGAARHQREPLSTTTTPTSPW